VFNLCKFLDDSSIARLLKQQITHLHLSFKTKLPKISTYKLSKNVYARIFTLAEKLIKLDFSHFNFSQPSLSFQNSLLDGLLPQLSNFHVIIRHIDQSSLSIDNTVSTFNNYFDQEKKNF
jgi:hypothetical protein